MGFGLEARFDNSLFFFVETCEEDVLCEKKGGATYPTLRRVLEIHWKKNVGLLKWCHSQWREGFFGVVNAICPCGFISFFKTPFHSIPIHKKDIASSVTPKATTSWWFQPISIIFSQICIISPGRIENKKSVKPPTIRQKNPQKKKKTQLLPSSTPDFSVSGGLGEGTKRH